MPTKRSVLMVAYYFPPLGGSGALRPLKLAKYLPESGWNPVVLSVRNPDWYYAADTDLAAELPREVTLDRTLMIRSAWIYYSLNPLRFRRLDNIIRRVIFHPDEQIGWIPFALAAAGRLIRRHDIRAVYSTSSPLSCHLIAYFISKRFGLPWVADFRDEWVENPDMVYPTRIHRRFHFFLEKKIAESADQLIAPAPEFCRLLQKHPGCAPCETLYMGFDPRDRSPEPGGERPAVASGRFTLVFSGLFYGSFRPDGLLKVINTLIDRGEVPREGVRMIFVGANSAADLREKDRYGICEFTGFVAHRTALGYIDSADALLLLLSDERGKNVVPSKTFEYLAAGKPILALVPADGDVAGIIRGTRSGRVADFGDDRAVESAFLSLYRQWREAEPFRPEAEAVAAFDQRAITRRLAELLNDMTGDK